MSKTKVVIFDFRSFSSNNLAWIMMEFWNDSMIPSSKISRHVHTKKSRTSDWSLPHSQTAFCQFPQVGRRESTAHRTLKYSQCRPPQPHECSRNVFEAFLGETFSSCTVWSFSMPWNICRTDQIKQLSGLFRFFERREFDRIRLMERPSTKISARLEKYGRSPFHFWPSCFSRNLPAKKRTAYLS